MGVATGRFRRSDRLLDSRDYRRVLRGGKRRADPALVVVTAPPRPAPERRAGGKARSDGDLRDPGAAGPRLGITIGRRVGNAVVRNRFKRRVRAWFRAHRDELAGGPDLVVIARPPGAGLSGEALDRRLARLLKLPRPQAEDR